jgi:hypothetical protein
MSSPLFKKNNRYQLIDDEQVQQYVNELTPPPKADYWAPAKSGAKSFYEKWIKPNILPIVLIILFILFLIYRYKTTQKEKSQTPIKNQPVQQIQTRSDGSITLNRDQVRELTEALEKYKNREYQYMAEPKIYRDLIRKNRN